MCTFYFFVYTIVTIFGILFYCSPMYTANASAQDNLVCTCVPNHLCNKNFETNIFGKGLFDIRQAKKGCPKHYITCCKSSEDEIKEAKVKPCGLQKSGEIHPRITSSSDITQFAELPWTVLIFASDLKEKREFICGGSLIHPQVVITAAHCTAQNEHTHLKIRAGEWNVRSTNEPLPHQDNSVKEVLVHPEYKSQILWNDIALLFLSEAFNTTENIGFICLPPAKLKTDNAHCIASGWGRDAFKGTRYNHRPSILRKVSLPIVQRNRCLAALRNTKLGKYFQLHRSFICAGGKKNRDTCKGDGGSPLVCPIQGHKSKLVQVGIVSWGIGCGTKNTPGVYAHVNLYKGWIDKVFQERNLSMKFYTI